MTILLFCTDISIYIGVCEIINIFFCGGGGWGLGDPYFFLHISSSWVKIRLHTENELPMLPGSTLKVPGWWWGGGGGFLPIIKSSSNSS